MASTTSSQRRIEKVSSDNIVISFDLLSNLAYMATLSAAKAPRQMILQKAGEQVNLKTSVVFEQVYLLAQRLGVEYTRALQMVAEKARASNLKSLLLRFASSIASGESEHVFLREESRIEAGRYANEYARSIENLKKWTDAYAAMMVSVTLIVVVAMISTLLGAMGSSFIIIVGVTMLLITSGGVYIILRTAPYEQITYDGDTDGPPDRARARFYLRTLVPLGVLLVLGGGYLTVALGAGYETGVGLALIGLAAVLFPTGYFARRDAGRMDALDGEVPTFIRSLGTIAGTTRSTLSTAMLHLDLESMGSLEPHVTRLRTRLSSELPADLTWERFNTETGNELLRRSTEMLVDGVEMGANGEEVADIVSSYASNVTSLRETRQMTSSSFAFLVIPMHTAMTALLLFILQIVVTFDEKLREVAVGITGEVAGAGASVPGLDMFQAQDLTLISTMITMVILILTVSNALASKFAGGGHNLKIAFSLAVMSLISGANFLLVPQVGGSLLSAG